MLTVFKKSHERHPPQTPSNPAERPTPKGNVTSRLCKVFGRLFAKKRQQVKENIDEEAHLSKEVEAVRLAEQGDRHWEAHLGKEVEAVRLMEEGRCGWGRDAEYCEELSKRLVEVSERKLELSERMLATRRDQKVRKETARANEVLLKCTVPSEMSWRAYALRIAASNGDKDICTFLIEANVDIHTNDKDDRALRNAAQQGHIEVVDLLRHANSRYHSGNYTAFFNAIFAICDSNLDVAQSSLDVMQVQYLPRHELEALMNLALAKGDVAMVMLLLQKSAPEYSPYQWVSRGNVCGYERYFRRWPGGYQVSWPWALTEASVAMFKQLLMMGWLPLEEEDFLKLFEAMWNGGHATAVWRLFEAEWFGLDVFERAIRVVSSTPLEEGLLTWMREKGRQRHRLRITYVRSDRSIGGHGLYYHVVQEERGRGRKNYDLSMHERDSQYHRCPLSHSFD
ncbi:hypothetical protein HDV00_011274 [Rhizophlyctis rosea]|nr:hypothetical protein HDV00_011274 [Rhizophlyctis rosea]